MIEKMNSPLRRSPKTIGFIHAEFVLQHMYTRFSPQKYVKSIYMVTFIPFCVQLNDISVSTNTVFF
jgi:hypothetical protein